MHSYSSISLLKHLEQSPDIMTDQNRAQQNRKNMSIPEFSKLHPVIPRRYVPEWTNDMRNRELIMKNCEVSGIIPKGPHDESLFLDKRERMNEVEPRQRCESKRPALDRYTALRPDFHTSQSKYQSSLMFRRDDFNETQ